MKRNYALVLILAVAFISVLAVPIVKRDRSTKIAIPSEAKQSEYLLPDATTQNFETNIALLMSNLSGNTSRGESSRPGTDCRGPCDETIVLCVNWKILREVCGRGASACVSNSDCIMVLDEDTCEKAGIQSSHNKKTGEFVPQSIDSLWGQVGNNSDEFETNNQRCLAWHELTHLEQNTCDQSQCEMESEAYSTQSICLDPLEPGGPCSVANPSSRDCADQISEFCQAKAFGEASKCQSENSNCECTGCQTKCGESMQQCIEEFGSTAPTNIATELRCGLHKRLYCIPTPTPSPTSTAAPSPSPTPSQPPVFPTALVTVRAPKGTDIGAGLSHNSSSVSNSGSCLPGSQLPHCY